MRNGKVCGENAVKIKNERCACLLQASLRNFKYFSAGGRLWMFYKLTISVHGQHRRSVCLQTKANVFF